MLPDERDLRARKALYDWERDGAMDYFMGNPKFKRTPRQLALDYSLLVEDWLTGFDVFVKPTIGKKVTKDVRKVFGRRAAGMVLEGIEGVSDVLSLVPPYIERTLPRQFSADKVAQEFGRKYAIERSILLEGSDLLPEPFKSYAETQRKYSDIADELSQIYDKEITDDDIYSAVRSVFGDKESYVEFHKEKTQKAIKCIEYFEREVGKESAKNPQLIALFGSFRPAKRYVRAMGQIEEELAKKRAEDIF